jgi:hypothetical protein
VELQQYLALISSLFSSFRRQVSAICGDKGEAIISRAEERVREGLPGFDFNALDQQGALSLLDLIETIIKYASMFKRSRLRQAALTQVSELYTRHYALLEEVHATETLEQFYYRLAK